MVTLSFERGTAFVGDLLEAVELLAGTVALAQRTGRGPIPGSAVRPVTSGPSSTPCGR